MGTPMPLPLDKSSMVQDRVLLFDSSTQVIVCKGAGIGAWLRSAQEADSAVQLEKLVSSAKDDAALLEAGRFPAPEGFECEQYGSKARYLTQKLNPDVPLSEFLQSLYKATVS